MSEEIEQQSLEEEEVEFFEFIQINKKALRVKLSEGVYDEKIPSHCSLLVLSNIYGFFVAATNKGFIYASTQDLRDKFEASKADSKELLTQKVHIDVREGQVICLRLSSDHLTLAVCINNGQILLYDVTKVALELHSIKPYQILSFDDEIKDARPNPGEKYNSIAILLMSGNVLIRDFLSDEEIGTIQSDKIGEQITSICWSPKGKQLVCGCQNGKLIKYTPEGVSKGIINPPPDLEQIAYFVVQENDSEHEVYVVSQEPKIKTNYYKFPYICGPSGRDKLPYLYMESIKDWGSNLKNLVICASANSTDINTVARDKLNNWSSWILADTNRAVLPLSDIHEEDTLPVGLALDFTCTDYWSGLVAGEEKQIPPVPILYILNDECDILGYRCFYNDAIFSGENFSEISPPKVLPTTGHSSGVISQKKDLLPDETKSENITLQNNQEQKSYNINASEQKNKFIPSTPIINSNTDKFNTKNREQNSIDDLSETTIKNNYNQTSVLSEKTNLTDADNKLSPPYTINDINDDMPQYNKRRAETVILNIDRFNAAKNAIDKFHEGIKRVEENCILKYKMRSNERSLYNINSLLIGDLPFIILETKELEDRAEDYTKDLVDLKHQVLNFSDEVSLGNTKAKNDLQRLQDAPRIISVGSRLMIQKRIKDRIETVFKNVKESIKALETQLNTLHEQIKEKKNSGLLRQSPLDYIDRSIRNISKGLYHNVTKIDHLNAQLDKLSQHIITTESEASTEDVSEQIIKEVKSVMNPKLNISYSIDAAKATSTYLNKESFCEKFKNLNRKKRKNPIISNLFEDKVIGERKPMPSITISPKKNLSPMKIRDIPAQSYEPKLVHTQDIPKNISNISSPSNEPPFSNHFQTNLDDDDAFIKISVIEGDDSSSLSRTSEFRPTYDESEKSKSEGLPSETESLIISKVVENATTVEPVIDTGSEIIQEIIETKNDSKFEITDKDLNENFNSFGFEEPSNSNNSLSQLSGISEFGMTSSLGTLGNTVSEPVMGQKIVFGTSTPSPSPSPFGGNNESIPRAFAIPPTPPSNVNAFGPLPSSVTQTPTFGSPNPFGQPAFGQTGFVQNPAFGQPAFGQHGFGQRPASTLGVSPASMKAPSGGGFARFASNNAFGSFGEAANSPSRLSKYQENYTIMLRSLLLLPTLSARQKICFYTTSITPDESQVKLNNNNNNNDKETLLTKTERAERVVNSLIEHIQTKHIENVGDTFKVEKVKADDTQENSNVEQNKSSNISRVEVSNVNSNVEPVSKKSFAERAKAGFPKKFMPSELANKWEKPKERLQLFDSIDFGPIGVPSRFVEIRNLPHTIIPRDIQMLAVDIPNGISAINEISPIRNNFFQFMGAIEMSFHSEKDAPKNYELKPRMPSNNMRGTANNGTSVIVSGLPRHVALEQIREFITDIPNNQQQIWKNIFELPVAGASPIYSKYLIVMRTKPEAYRLVRKLHNTYFAKDFNSKRFPIKAKIVLLSIGK
ncbi:805_t:CDS:10 [Diversispora eburnea]|uniref:805_t:CDS:1 n=1 Tax=Diversispora eburnea TaxID=1213867 RepID=A0A9N8VKD1_9GLOM|nr:805_t:CDS:10 [Diversispora eburnea]